MFLFRAALLAIACTAHAGVKLPAIISDHMVPQNNATDAIWGWAAPGESVTVSIAGQTQATTAAANGRWNVRLEHLTASSEPQTLTVTGRNTLTLDDVLVGEVWLASGQSNMEMRLKDKLHGSVDNADEEIAAAKYPAIRVFMHNDGYAIYDLPLPPAEPMADRPGQWVVCSLDTPAGFSAMGCFFARDLHARLRVPVGIVTAAVGGTPIEAWTSLAAQEAEPALKPVLDGELVIVSSATVPNPSAVRYGWAANPRGNLVNGATLPASPFRTDDWD